MPKVRNIFLIEDDQDDLEFFMAALRNIDDVWLSDVAVNGREAIEKLRFMPVLPSIIFVNYYMPIMDGLDFLKEKAKYPLIKNVPVAVLSSSLEKREEALKNGAKTFIVKSHDESSLRAEVEQAVNMGL
ncbi:response regulator [Parachryseolinea silvisoli]|uniref:response regulator n=1 Tax=Parachryseolinea silvisoli TaxID=2873601 RepID=UPI00226594AF|nr:response regulator [Parachryseolinea silvisoli]MCD9019225.1 response regulator [Parachryseolinea silvisoli]